MFNRFLILILFTSLSFSAPSFSYSYQLRWASGSELNEQQLGDQTLTDYGFFENLVGISGYLYNDWFVSLDIEYSPEPAYGMARTDFTSIPTSFFIEKQTDKIYFKAGTLSTLYGQGMSINMMHDQVRDFNNTLNGLELSYSINDNLKILSTLGLGNINYRSNASFRETDLSAGVKLFAAGAEYFHDNTGSSVQYYLTGTSVSIGPESIYLYRGVRTTLGLDLSYRLSNMDRADGIPGGLCLLEPGSGTPLDCEISDEVLSFKHDIIFDTSIGNLGLFVNAQLDRYQKIYGDDFTNGYNLYMALYTDIMDWGVTADFKSYYSPYKLQMVSSKPTVYREVNSTLLSRASHHFWYNNEHGMQIDITRYLDNGLFLNINYAFSRRYAIDSYEANGMEPITKGSSAIWDRENYPYSQFFTEVSGYMFDDKVFFKLGYDNFYEQKCEKGLIRKNTIPTNLSLALNDKYSVALYSEFQYTREEIDESSRYSNINLNFASNFSYKGKFIVTLMHEYEKLEYREEPGTWSGVNLTMYPKDNIQLEVFYGSIKGGLVCANGVCAVQPGFTDGVKVLVRTSF